MPIDLLVPQPPRSERRRAERYLQRMMTRSLQTNLQKIHEWFEYELGLCEVNQEDFDGKGFFAKMALRFPPEVVAFFKNEYEKAKEEAAEEAKAAKEKQAEIENLPEAKKKEIKTEK